MTDELLEVMRMTIEAKGFSVLYKSPYCEGRRKRVGTEECCEKCETEKGCELLCKGIDIVEATKPEDEASLEKTRQSAKLGVLLFTMMLNEEIKRGGVK